MSDRLETMPLSVVLRSVGGAVVDGAQRPALLAAVLDPDVSQTRDRDARILVFPRPRRPYDDEGPAAA